MARSNVDEALARIDRVAREGSRQLDLSNLKLRSLPPLPAAPSGLRVLDLSGNQLQDLPPWVGEIASLERLDLGNNRFSELPSVVPRLAGLRSLDLSENRLAALPDGIAACGRLIGLHLYRNRLAALPGTIVGLEQLEWLDASSNQLRVLPPLDERLARLAILDLRNNRLESLPAGLGKLRGLRVLRLSGNRLESVDAVLPLSQLEALEVDSNRLKSLPPELAAHPALRVISAENNPLGDLSPGLRGLGGAEGRRRAELILKEHITGGMEERTRYFEAVPYRFDSDLALTGRSSVYGLLDLYYKQLGADCPAVLKYPDGETIDLNSLTQKTATRIAREHEASLDSDRTILHLPGGTGETYDKMYSLALETIARLPSVQLVPRAPGGGPIEAALDATHRELYELMIRQRDREEGPDLVGPGETADLMVNVWLEGAEEPLLVGKPYRLGIDVGKPRVASLVTRPLVEPDWEEEKELDLVIVVSGDDIKVDPPRRLATLHRREGMEEIFFDVTPLRGGRPEFFVSILLARELFLLQKIRIVLHDVVEEAAQVLP